MLSDFHLHSHFSGDCQVPIHEMIQSAIDKGVNRLCFTDHHDLDFPHPTINFELDLESYYTYFKEAKGQYQDKIQLLMGIELGMQPHLHSTLSQIVKTYPFDFIIASNHLSHGIDVYDKIYFEERSQYKGYLEYFEDMLENVKGYTDYDVYGHLDYVIRYGDFANKKLAYKDFKELLDEILRVIIHSGKGIEVNTSGYKYGLENPHPSLEIIQHYKDLGGQIITLGSDAHMPGNICSNFERAKDLLRGVGFKYVCTFVERQAEFHAL